MYWVVVGIVAHDLLSLTVIQIQPVVHTARDVLAQDGFEDAWRCDVHVIVVVVRFRPDVGIVDGAGNQRPTGLSKTIIGFTVIVRWFKRLWGRVLPAKFLGRRNTKRSQT